MITGLQNVVEKKFSTLFNSEMNHEISRKLPLPLKSLSSLPCVK